MKPKWKLSMRIAGSTCQSLHRDDGLGVQMETIYKRRTDRFGNVKCGKAKSFFFIDGDPREFESEAEMLAALNPLRSPGVKFSEKT